MTMSPGCPYMQMPTSASRDYLPWCLWMSLSPAWWPAIPPVRLAPPPCYTLPPVLALSSMTCHLYPFLSAWATALHTLPYLEVWHPCRILPLTMGWPYPAPLTLPPSQCTTLRVVHTLAALHTTLSTPTVVHPPLLLPIPQHLGLQLKALIWPPLAPPSQEEAHPPC